MKKDKFLYIGIFISVALHLLLYRGVLSINHSRKIRLRFEKSNLIEFEVKKPEPKPEQKPLEKPEPKPKPKLKPKPKPKPKKVKAVKEKVQQAPISHVRKESDTKEVQTDVKPVFGVTKKTVTGKGGSGIGVRVGNTLMKEQEKEYTPPEKVKDYAAGKKIEERKYDKNIKKFSPVPVFEISKMPAVKKRVTPEYPEELRDEELDGKVILRLGIDREGKVKTAKVVRSDHKLFAKAAVKAIKKWHFTPARLANGEKVDCEINFTVTFELEEF